MARFNEQIQRAWLSQASEEHWAMKALLFVNIDRIRRRLVLHEGLNTIMEQKKAERAERVYGLAEEVELDGQLDSCSHDFAARLVGLTRNQPVDRSGIDRAIAQWRPTFSNLNKVLNLHRTDQRDGVVRVVSESNAHLAGWQSIRDVPLKRQGI